MPGIAGIVSRALPDECEALLQVMIAAMRHDVTYVSSTHSFPGMGVYAGWVAHEGSFAAQQSATSTKNSASIAFSGECFSDDGLVADQVQVLHGARSRSGSGGGALLSLYEANGVSFIAQLNGLFSGFLIDSKRKLALLFNDRYGGERVYYCKSGDAILFASEAKALLSALPELRAFDDRGVAQFLTYGSTLDGQTLFRNLRFLPGGSLWRFEGSAMGKRTQYFRPDHWESQSVLTQEDYESKFADAFKRILPRYLSSESKLGISITGGLDSRMIMACLTQGKVKPVCYTFAGVGGNTLDARLGARVAKVCGLEHDILRVGPRFLSNFRQYVDRTVFLTDGCAGALVAHEIYLNALARQLSPVRLTGNFGSEILRSASTLKPIKLENALIRSDIRNVPGVERATREDVHPVTHAAFREIPWHLFGTLAAARTQITFRTPYLDNEIVRLAYQAPTVARKSPRASLNVINGNNSALGAIPTDRGVTNGSQGPFNLLRRLFCSVTFKLDYLHTEGLPDWMCPVAPLLGQFAKIGLLGLHKYLPYRVWFQGELAPYVREVFTDPRTRQMPYWSSSGLESIVEGHVSGRKNYVNEIHAILTLEATERMLLKR